MSESNPSDKLTVRTVAADLVSGSTEMSFHNVRDSIKLMRLAAYATHQTLEGSVFPALEAVIGMQETWSGSVTTLLRGDRKLREFARENVDRVKSAAKFGRLVKKLGRQLYGSATFVGEQVLEQDEFLKLSYLPPKPGVPIAPVALFHAGGGLPYGDRIFRFLPEANFYDRFLERGMPVYAVELRGDRSELNYAGLTLERLIDSFEAMSAAAFDHNEKRKMVLEGYCGHGMQVVAFAAAKPKEVQERFVGLSTFVSPFDGRECLMLAEMQTLMPESMTEMSFVLAKILGRGYVPGDGMRMSLDMGLRTTFHKTPLAHVAAGFRQLDYANVRKLEDLSKHQRKDLAGAYWISPESARRFALPVDLVRYASRLFSEGIAADGTLPAVYRGRTLSLRTLLDETTLPIVGFFGGRDLMIPDRTAYGIMPLLGNRYRHVVHPHAGHISYILSPKSWRSGPMALEPNPVDVMMELAR
jgi:hypothetical protein